MNLNWILIEQFSGSALVCVVIYIFTEAWIFGIRPAKRQPKFDVHVSRHVRDLNKIISEMRTEFCQADAGTGGTQTIPVTYGIFATVRISPCIEELVLFSINRNVHFAADLARALRAKNLRFELIYCLFHAHPIMLRSEGC